MDSTWEQYGRETRGDVDRLRDVVLFVGFLASAVDEQEMHILESTLQRDVLHFREFPG